MGKTTVLPLYLNVSWKHPHVHGEDAEYTVKVLTHMETPPRAWGRLTVL